MANERIFMTADTVGGVWTYAIELVEGLCRGGAQVGLATMGAPLDAGQRAQCRRIPGLEVFESNYRLEWMNDPWVDVERAGEWLLWLAQRLRPDVVHLNGYCHAALPWPAPVVVVGHSCVSSWWNAVRRESTPRRYAPYRQAVRDGLTAAASVVAPTQAMLRALERCYGPLPQGRVIHNGIELSRYRPGRKQPVILGAGRLWDEAKNFSAVAQVAPRLSWPVQLAGDALGFFDEPPVFENVELLGKLSRQQLADRLATASIFAHPARYEPFGLVPLEAAASGCALVLGDVDSLREVWGDAACFVDPSDAEQLEGVLHHLVASDAKRAVLAERAQRRARVFGREAMWRAYGDLYASLSAPPASTERPQIFSAQQAAPQ